MVQAEPRPLVAGSALLIAVTFSLVLPGYLLAATLAVPAVPALATGVILNADEKRRVRESAMTWLVGFTGWSPEAIPADLRSRFSFFLFNAVPFVRI